MKIAHFEHQGQRYLGTVDVERGVVHPFVDAGGSPPLSSCLVDYLGKEGGTDFSAIPQSAPVTLNQVRLLAPIAEPRRNIMCVGKNYYEHAHEFSRSGYDVDVQAGREVPDRPIFFTKATTAVIGPGASINSHSSVTRQMDYESELGVVIGRRGQAIDAVNALAYVFGYTIINDVTARDLQKAHKQWFLGKSLDSFCPMGPWIVTADELNPADLELRCWVNDELRQQANTRNLIFGIPQLIAELSRGMTLLPGDIIATGTPAGVGVGFNPPRFLQSGDRVRIEISGIGTLENVVGDP